MWQEEMSALKWNRHCWVGNSESTYKYKKRGSAICCRRWKGSSRFWSSCCLYVLWQYRVSLKLIRQAKLNRIVYCWWPHNSQNKLQWLRGISQFEKNAVGVFKSTTALPAPLRCISHLLFRRYCRCWAFAVFRNSFTLSVGACIYIHRCFFLAETCCGIWLG